MDHKILFLTGMPGAGKSYWGERIARRVGFRFVDLDEYIEEQERATIPALFARYDEHGFREREHKHLQAVIRAATTPAVVACGGGTPCFHDNMRLMKEAGVVVFLDAHLDKLLTNLEGSEAARPLLAAAADLRGHLERLLQKRRDCYMHAQYILHTDDISLTTFDEIISLCINRQ
jgi:shikimate kinase